MGAMWIKHRLFRTRIWLAVSALTLVLSIAMGLLFNALLSQQEKLAQLEKEHPVWVHLSDATGAYADGLDIINSFIWIFTRDGYAADNGVSTSEFFSRVCLKLSKKIPVTDASGEASERLLLGITHRESVPSLSEDSGTRVEFLEGYSWADFSEDKAVCLLPSDLVPLVEDGAIELLVDGTAKSFTHIGTTYGVSKNICVPWAFFINAYNNGLERSESLSALVADNTRLAEMKTRMERHFPLKTSVDSRDIFNLAMTVFDEPYLQAHKGASQMVRLLRALQPVFVAFCLGAGLFSGAVLFRTRRREYALLRSVGVAKIPALGLLSAEYIIASLLGGAAGLISAVFVPQLKHSMALIPVVILCLLAGIAVSQLVIMKKSALYVLQANE
ncbi:MAG: hypothetical protein Q4C04_05725 [Clostridia bacterium]|nr:hypothetical protein [Clostridia bacterium]